MLAYTKPQQWKKEGERLRGERGKTFQKLHVLGMNDDFWDRVREIMR